MIEYFTAGGNGGFFEIDNPKMTMDYQDTNWNHLYSNDKGGYIYGTGDIDGSFEIKCKMGNITSLNDPGTVGPASGASGDTIVNCSVSCESGIVTPQDYDTRIAMA